MKRYCDEDFCSRDYGFRQVEDGSVWCNTCGYMEFSAEDMEDGEVTEEELRELLR